MQGFHRTYATGAACQQRTLTPPDTWSCPTLGLACVLMSRPISPELVLSPDLCISNTPRYFSFAYELMRLKERANFVSSGSKIARRLRRRQYNQFMIEKTIDLMPDPYTVLHWPFLKHSTLTKKAIETIWRSLSKPQRQQDPDCCPLCLFVGTPSATIPELASILVEHSLPYVYVTEYVLVYNIYYLCCLINDIYYLSAWYGCWSVV